MNRKKLFLIYVFMCVGWSRFISRGINVEVFSTLPICDLNGMRRTHSLGITVWFSLKISLECKNISILNFVYVREFKKIVKIAP